ncbi:MAG: repeat-containing protein [Rhizobiaceae bacterium]|jgi:tetratricopeptide (TPR) repeat protein|nr:repeat-containing protein [Rhizobiaceae bacterium]
MRTPIVISIMLLAAGVLAPLPLAAQDGNAPPSEAVEPLVPAKRLDNFFAELKRERNEKAAERIAARINEEWNSSGSAIIDLMMMWSKTAMEGEKFDVALDFLDQVVTISPAYAEGWNRRATVHFMMHNYSKSMSDINRTLTLEPRHFGALAGMAQIMENTGRKQLALTAWQRVLEIYPMMRSAQNEVATLSEELAGEGI